MDFLATLPMHTDFSSVHFPIHPFETDPTKIKLTTNPNDKIKQWQSIASTVNGHVSVWLPGRIREGDIPGMAMEMGPRVRVVLYVEMSMQLSLSLPPVDPKSLCPSCSCSCASLCLPYASSILSSRWQGLFLGLKIVWCGVLEVRAAATAFLIDGLDKWNAITDSNYLSDEFLASNRCCS